MQRVASCDPLAWIHAAATPRGEQSEAGASRVLAELAPTGETSAVEVCLELEVCLERRGDNGGGLCMWGMNAAARAYEWHDAAPTRCEHR